MTDPVWLDVKGAAARVLVSGRTILRASSYDMLWGPQAPTGGNSTSLSGDSIGLSWFRGSYNGRRVISHGGGDDGYRSYIVLVPDARAAVIVMTNSERSPVLSVVVRRSLDFALAQ